MLGTLDETYSNKEMSLEEITLCNKPLRIYQEIIVSAHDNPPENNLIEEIKKVLEKHTNSYNYTKNIYVLYIIETKKNVMIAALIKDKHGSRTFFVEPQTNPGLTAVDTVVLVQALFEIITVSIERR